MINLTIVIVSTNEKDLLSTCLSSIIRNKNSLSLQIVVVDNASTDGTRQYVRSRYPSARILVRKKKFGFAANCNLGIKYARAPYILILNPDTRMLPSTLPTLVAFMNSHNDVGICGPKMLFPNGKLQYSCRAFPNIQTVLVRRTSLRFFLSNSSINNYHLQTKLDHTKVQSVDWLLGGCILIRRKLVDEIGPFDQKYFLYVDDIDLCYRAWKHGWKVYYVPTAKAIHHHKAVSDKKLFSVASYHHLKSMVRYFYKHMLFHPEYPSYG